MGQAGFQRQDVRRSVCANGPARSASIARTWARASSTAWCSMPETMPSRLHMGVVAFVLPLPTGQVRVDDEVDGQVPKVSNPFPVRLVGCTKLTYQFLSPAAV